MDQSMLCQELPKYYLRNDDETLGSFHTSFFTFINILIFLNIKRLF